MMPKIKGQPIYFMSMIDGSFIAMGHIYSKGDEILLLPETLFEDPKETVIDDFDFCLHYKLSLLDRIKLWFWCKRHMKKENKNV